MSTTSLNRGFGYNILYLHKLSNIRNIRRWLYNRLLLYSLHIWLLHEFNHKPTPRNHMYRLTVNYPHDSPRQDIHHDIGCLVLRVCPKSFPKHKI